MATIVAVSGKSQHGKDVVANFLVRHFGFHRVAWSDELKHEVATRLRATVKAITAMDERLGLLPNLPMALRLRTHHENHPSEAWWAARIHYILNTERSPAIRALLQEYGTEVRRADNGDYWLDAWARRVRRVIREDALHPSSAEVRIVIPDTRFPNEAQRALDLGGILVRVERPGAPPCPTPNHPSETALDAWPNWDLRLLNVGTVDELERRTEAWLLAKRIIP